MKSRVFFDPINPPEGLDQAAFSGNEAGDSEPTLHLAEEAGNGPDQPSCTIEERAFEGFGNFGFEFMGGLVLDRLFFLTDVSS